MNRILSLFDCPLKDVKRLLPIIKRQGFNTVQVSPLQRNKEDGTNGWWLLYQPLGFEIGNKIGTKEELYDLCLEARKYGINIVVDAVINHVANKSDTEFLEPHPDSDPELLASRECFKEKIQISNWDDRYQVINYCLGLPGLDPNNPIVQRKIIVMLNEFIDLGVNGFRFDAAKSIALPEEGCNFFPNITYSLKRWLPIIYGEVLFADNSLIEKYARYMRVLTNSDAENKDSVIKFIENKDSFLSKDLGYTKGYSKERITSDYYNLAGSYPNTLYYARNYTDDWYEWQSSGVRDANQRLVRKRL
jgi:alpha-amylase